MCLQRSERPTASPCGSLFTLIFAVTSLNFLVGIFLNVALENPRSGGLVELCCFQDMCRIDPIIVPPSHHMLLQVSAKLELVDGNLQVASQHSGPELQVSGRVDIRNK